jgi:hypothetical protein
MTITRFGSIPTIHTHLNPHLFSLVCYILTSTSLPSGEIQAIFQFNYYKFVIFFFVFYSILAEKLVNISNFASNTNRKHRCPFPW